MSMAKWLVNAGFSFGQAKAVGGNVSLTVSAAGTTLATATVLTTAVNLVTTVGASAGVALPSCEVGDGIEIYNATATALTVYPDKSTAQINSITAGGGMTLASNTNCIYRHVSSTRWVANLSA